MTNLRPISRRLFTTRTRWHTAEVAFVIGFVVFLAVSFFGA